MLNVLLGLIWMFGVCCLISEIMEGPICDHELMGLYMQLKEFMEAFWVFL